MSRWLRALLISAAATGAAAALLRWLPAWDRPSPRRASSPRSHEDVVDELSDLEKEQMLRELGYHV